MTAHVINSDCVRALAAMADKEEAARTAPVVVDLFDPAFDPVRFKP